MTGTDDLANWSSKSFPTASGLRWRGISTATAGKISTHHLEQLVDVHENEVLDVKREPFWDARNEEKML